MKIIHINFIIIKKLYTTVTVIDLEKIENNNITFLDRENQYVYPRKPNYANRKINITNLILLESTPLIIVYNNLSSLVIYFFHRF
jgi:hypothetical protein